MKQLLIFVLLLAGCAQKPKTKATATATPTPTATSVPTEKTNLNEFELLATKAEYFAQALYKNPEALSVRTYGPKCFDANCLKENLRKMHNGMKATIDAANLGSPPFFEVQNIKYFDDGYLEVLLFASDGHRKSKGVAVMLKLRSVQDDWKLDISDYIK